MESSRSRAGLLDLGEIWRQHVPGKMRHFLWQCSQGILPTRYALGKRLHHGSSVCGCGEERESIAHLLFRCQEGIEVWHFSPLHIDSSTSLDNDFETWWAWLKERVNEARDVPNGLTMTVFIMWYLWRERNDRTFKGSQGSMKLTCASQVN